jgi:hypothetical protein
MQRALKLLLACCTSIVLVLFSCATAGGNKPAAINAPPVESSSDTGQSARDAEKRMKGFLDNGMEKIEDGSVSEGIQQLVAVLAVRDSLDTPSKATDDLARKAETELTTIGSALTLDTGTEWVDVNKNQIAGSVLDVGTTKAIQPSVILSYDMGHGRTLVPGAPIRFEFVKGSGTITAYVTTNEYGQANSTIAKLDSQTQEQIIRASLEYTVGGYTYKFQGVVKDFAYIPPARKATILVLERSPSGPNQPPLILDSVYNTLKGVTFDLSNYDGTLIGDSFMKVFSGDPAAIKALGVKKDVSYLVTVLSDCLSANQVVLEGKKYNLYKSKTTATARIIRVADGKILYSAALQGVSGQGGTPDQAILDGYKNASLGMAEKLKGDLAEINQALNPKAK